MVLYYDFEFVHYDANYSRCQVYLDSHRLVMQKFRSVTDSRGSRQSDIICFCIVLAVTSTLLVLPRVASSPCRQFAASPWRLLPAVQWRPASVSPDIHTRTQTITVNYQSLLNCAEGYTGPVQTGFLDRILAQKPV